MRAVFCAAWLLAVGCLAKRSSKDWGELDMEKIDKEWADGDDAEELRTERQIYEEEVDRRKKDMNNMDLDKLQAMNPDDLKTRFAHQQSQSGMAMMFVTLTAIDPETKAEWTQPNEEKLASRFTALLQTGGLKVSVYRIDPRRLLLTMQSGWYGADAKNFLVEQPAVMKVTWDSVDYLNENVEQIELPEAPAKKKATPKRKKKAKKKEDL